MIITYKHYEGGHQVARGEEIARFDLGSSVVLVFEAPKNFEFFINAGDRIKVGQAVGHVKPVAKPVVNYHQKSEQNLKES